MKRALISVSDKTNIVKFAQKLIKNGFEIISTGGTKIVLEKANIKTIAIEDFTKFPEILEGRVKTLHPLIHGALLNLRDNHDHQDQVLKHHIKNIDLVVVNLYPFQKTIAKSDCSLQEAIENIDIGGPSMLRSAAKNYQSVTVVTDVNDYDLIISEIEKQGQTSWATREKLAAKAFQKTAYYDSLISNYFSKITNENFPQTITLGFEKKQDLRYGENPHQKAAFYQDLNDSWSLQKAHQIQGKKLSYNNIQDTNAAILIMKEFDEPVVVGLKHMNPCGVGTGLTGEAAWDNCYAGDSTSIFGGIVACNQNIDQKMALKMSKIFLEVIIAPSYDDEALAIFAKKKNLRLLQLDLTNNNVSKYQYTSVNGGILKQEWDRKNIDDCTLEQVSKMALTSDQVADAKMGQKIVKHVKSNAIVVVKNKQLIGVGAGQMNRIGAAKLALEWAGEKAQGAILASDAFFPFDDVVKLAYEYGVKAIVQPGGSIRDQDSIAAADDYQVGLIFTNMRHFRH